MLEHGRGRQLEHGRGRQLEHGRGRQLEHDRGWRLEHGRGWRLEHGRGWRLEHGRGRGVLICRRWGDDRYEDRRRRKVFVVEGIPVERRYPGRFESLIKDVLPREAVAS
ncbi:hypothetical protein FJT64_004045 [Amphibalanus amphitrite]|uniref:Uncharacterized protein n=1 Tax=Amphibalanus amphitrite TaxID=1232801 RepID=A0A6A4VY47_AMPAM|nr:hypothetical protein FJT64_004045 [Amphibalanus amphitrite]